MKVRLTKKSVQGSKPFTTPYELRDTDIKGLLLRVQPSGVKSFVIEWGRGKRKTLGRFPVMTVEAARTQAIKMLAEASEYGAPKAATNRAGKDKPDTFGEFIHDHYVPHITTTAKAGKQTAALIEKHFSYLYDKPMTAITPMVWDKFKAKRVKAGVKPATINRDLDRLKAALGQATKWGVIEVNPLAGVERIKRGIEERVRYLSPAEEKALREALADREEDAKARRERFNHWREQRHKDLLPAVEGYSDHIMPMTLIALNTGLRRGEITQLTWDDIDIPGKMLTVRAGYAKSGKARHVPLNTEALRVLEQWREHHPDGRLFRLTCTAKSWGRLMERAGLEDFRFHDLRHDFASKLVMAGVDLNTVRELLGHGDIKMTLRYAHLAPEHKAAAVELLGRT